MKPEIKKYLDIFQYLQDIYLFRKGLNKNFSYATWSAELDIRNKAYLRLMVIGRRSINEKMMHKMIDNIELHKEDGDYFAALLGYSQSKNLAEKKVLGARMISLVRSDFTQDDVEIHFDFLSNPLLPKLHTLLSFDDIKKTPENLARLLGAEAGEIQEGLIKLEQLNLIDRNQDEIKSKATNFKVANYFKDLGLHAFYANLFEDGKKAIALPQEVRRFRSLFFAMNEEELQVLIGRMEEVSKEILARHDFSDLLDRRLYQFHYNFFPVSASQTSSQSNSQSNSQTSES